MDTFTHTKGREGGKERNQERGRDKGVMGGWKAGRQALVNHSVSF